MLRMSGQTSLWRWLIPTVLVLGICPATAEAALRCENGVLVDEIGKPVLPKNSSTNPCLNDSVSEDLPQAELVRVFDGHGKGVLSVAFSPDGRQVLTGSIDDTARLWDVATGRELRRLTGHGSSVYSVAFSPDGRLALTGSWDKTARLWEVATGRELSRLTGHGGNVNSVAFSPDGHLALTGSYDETARLWRIPEGHRKSGGDTLAAGAGADDVG